MIFNIQNIDAAGDENGDGGIVMVVMVIFMVAEMVVVPCWWRQLW